MRQFDELLEVASILNGPNGCSWDQKQTFFSLQPYVLEEAHEVVEAVDGEDDQEIIEELGDLLYTVIFYAKVAQKEDRFSIKEVLEVVKEKLIRRHPHVFGSLKVESEEEVIKNWERIKQEKEGKQKDSLLQGIPEKLPSLAKAQKMAKVFSRAGFVDLTPLPEMKEEDLAKGLFDLVLIAERSKVDFESALRRLLAREKQSFQDWEKK